MTESLLFFLVGGAFILLGVLHSLYMKQQKSLEDRIKELEDKK